jgi:hypothetical protein
VFDLVELMNSYLESSSLSIKAPKDFYGCRLSFISFLSLWSIKGLYHDVLGTFFWF